MNVGPFLKKLNSNFFWVVINQVLSRLLVAMKFFVLARVLGPHSMGILSTLLLILAMVETFTELGVLQSVVYQKGRVRIEQMHVIWTFNLLRGIGIGLIIVVAAPFLKSIFAFNESIMLIFLMALIPIIKGSSSYNLLLAERQGSFKRISLLQIFYVLIDFISAILISIITKNIVFVVYSMIISEFLRVVLSYILFKGRPKLRFNFNLMKENLNYGRWITLNSITVFLLNQMDKILTSRYLGTYQLGIYQMSSKLSQFALADLFSAICRYCFPLFSNYNRKNYKKLNELFLELGYLVFLGLTLFTTILFFNAEFITITLLGNQWTNSVKIFQVLLLSSYIGAMNMYLVTYLRSIGKPNIVTIATLIQLVIFLPLSFLAMSHRNLYILAVVVDVSVFVAFTTLVLYVSRYVKGLYKILLLSLVQCLPLVIAFYTISFFLSEFFLLCCSLILSCILIITKLKRVKKIIISIKSKSSDESEEILTGT
ncbi:oligosaccharide flippase family protein [Priestia megaterium]